MHWPFGHIVHYLAPKAVAGHGSALLLIAYSYFLVAYVDWVLLIGAITYGFYGFQILARKRAATEA